GSSDLAAPREVRGRSRGAAVLPLFLEVSAGPGPRSGAGERSLAGGCVRDRRGRTGPWAGGESAGPPPGGGCLAGPDRVIAPHTQQPLSPAVARGALLRRRAASARSGGEREAARGRGRESRLPPGRRRGPERRCATARAPAAGTSPTAIRPGGRRSTTEPGDVPGRGRNPARVFRVGPSSTVRTATPDRERLGPRVGEPPRSDGPSVADPTATLT